MPRKAILILLIALVVLGVGYTLSTPVWRCQTIKAPGGMDVVNRDCTHVPRSRALWDWATAPAAREPIAVAPPLR